MITLLPCAWQLGVPLSIFSRSYLLVFWYMMVLVPFICFCGAVNKVLSGPFSPLSMVTDIIKCYKQYLLHPDDWSVSEIYEPV